MTVTEQIAALTQSVEELKQTFMGRMSEWDDKVNSYVANIDTEFSESNLIDIDDIDGINNITDHIKQGKLNVVDLKNREHLLDAEISVVSANLLFKNGTINTTSEDNSAYNSLPGQILLSDGSSVRFSHVVINIAGKSNAELSWDNNSSLINANNTNAGSASLSLCFSRVNVMDGSSLIRNHIGANLSVGWYGGEIDGDGYISGHNTNNGTLALSLYSVGFSGGAKAMINGTVGVNVITNYSGSNLQ